MCFLRAVSPHFQFPFPPKLKIQSSIEHIIEIKEKTELNQVLDCQSFFISFLNSGKTWRRTLGFQIMIVIALAILIAISAKEEFLDQKNYTTLPITKAVLFVIFSAIILILSFLSFYKGKNSHFLMDKNMIVVFSIFLLLAFDPSYTLKWKSFYEEEDFVLSSDFLVKMDLFFFTLLTKLLNGSFLRIGGHLARAIMKISQIYTLDEKIALKDQFSELIFELFFLVVSVLFILTERKSKKQEINSNLIKNFSDKMTFWKQLLKNNNLISFALIKGHPPFELIDANQFFLETFDLKIDEHVDFLNKINVNMGILSQIKNKKFKPFGKLQTLLEKLWEEDQNHKEFNEKNPSIFYFFIADHKKHDKIKQFQGKLTKIADIMILVIEDISNLSVIETLQANNDYKSRLFSCFSHELKTPLNGSIPLLESILKDDESISARNLHLINCSVQSLKILQNSLSLFVDYSQMLSKKIYMNFTEFPLKGLIVEIQTLISQVIEEKRLKFTIMISSSVPEKIRTDYERLKQVLLSLLLNSLKFTSSGEIHLNLHLNQNSNEFLCFDIIDTGMGISEDKQTFLRNCLSDKNYLKMHLDPQSPFQGLIIAHKLACKLSPSLEKSSKGLKITSIENQKTAISFILENRNHFNGFTDKISSYYNDEEIFIEPAISTPNFSNYNSSKESSSQEILCVDDDPFNLLTLELMLAKMKKKCVKAFNGLEAIELVKKKGSFPLILMDYAMPVLDGVEATKKLRSLMEKNQIGDIPIVGCSAFNSKHERKKCIKAGMQAILEKPIKCDDLRKICDIFIRKE